MQKRELSVRDRIAETEVTQLVAKWVGKSRSMQRSVMIIGNSRFGKSESIKAHAAAHPGRCRFVNTPATNAMSDLVREIALAIGLDVGLSKRAVDLREQILYVLRFSHLQLIFDEAQRLLPTNYSRNTAPARLNWVRGSIMDNGLPVVFVCTPQSYLPAKRRFLKVTGFAMEQFDERLITIQLPNELCEQELLDVARFHLPGLADEYLQYVVANVLATERNFVSDIEKIAALAKDNAREALRKSPTLGDIKAAMAIVLPTVVNADAEQPTEVSPKSPTASSIQASCKSGARRLPAHRNGFEALPKPRRATRALVTL